MNTLSSNLFLDLRYTPSRMVSTWERSSMLSNFCSTLFFSDVQTKNFISTILNDLIELSVKYGSEKDCDYGLRLNQSKTGELMITMDLLLTQQKGVLFSRFLKTSKLKHLSLVLKEALYSDYSDLMIFLWMLLVFGARVSVKRNALNLNKSTNSVKTMINIAINLEENVS